MKAELLPYHLNLQFEGGPPPAGLLDRLASFPEVEIVAEGASILARPLGSETEVFQTFGQGGLDGQLGHAFERPRLDAGRLPRQADEVLLSRRQSKALGLQVGDTLVLETFTPEAIEQIFSGAPTPYDGPRVSLRIVGVGRQPEELTGGPNTPTPQYVLPPAFFKAWEGKVAWFGGIYLVRLHDGIDAVDAFTRSLSSTFPERDDIAIHASEEGVRIDDAVSAQATALALLAAVSFVTGVLAISQAAIRMARSAEPDSRVLAALGLDRGQLAAARAALVVTPVVLGVVVATLVAWALSGLFPNGPAGLVEPHPGIRADVPVLLSGSLAIAAVAVAATVVLVRSRSNGAARPSRIGDRVGRSMPTVATTVGVQGALRRTSGTATASTRSAMVALGAGVAGLVGSLVFGASLARLVDDPGRQGWNWDYEVALGDELTDEAALEQAHAVSDDPRIEAASYARIATKDLAGLSTVVFGVESLRGGLHLTVVEGDAVRADDEIVLGQSTLDELGARVGGTVTVDGADGPLVLRIVGQGLFPTNEAEDPAAGAAVTLTTIQRLGGSDGFPDVFVTVAPGVDEAALRADFEGEFGAMTSAIAPPVVGNLELVDQAPYLLAGYLALLGLAASAHAIVMVVRLRRGELATLRALGFDRRQVAGTVLAHSVTVAVIGVVVGLPLGLAVGRVAWRLVAGGLGFATDPRNPVAALVATGPGTIALAVAIALIPALWAARQRPGAVLRTE